MMHKKSIPPFGLRLPPELKSYLQDQAAINHRSLNSEIQFRLEQSRGIDAHKQESPAS